MLRRTYQFICIPKPNAQSITATINIFNSRFDFSGIDRKRIYSGNKECLCALIESIENMKYDEKISYFPDGYRKSNKDVVSPSKTCYWKQ